MQGQRGQVFWRKTGRIVSYGFDPFFKLINKKKAANFDSL
jgi:hypothetical protein